MTYANGALGAVGEGAIVGVLDTVGVGGIAVALGTVGAGVIGGALGSIASISAVSVPSGVAWGGGMNGISAARAGATADRRDSHEDKTSSVTVAEMMMLMAMKIPTRREFMCRSRSA
jgi:hypothetical protein